MNDFQTLFIAVFANENFGFVALAALLVLGFFSSARLFFKARKVKKELHDAIAFLEQIEDEREFTERFGEIDQKFQAIPTLKRSWEEYTETLIPPLESVDDPAYRVYRNTKRPQDFMTPEAVLHDVRPFMDGERLIGFGLLLTFTGLVAALMVASQLFTGGSDQMMAGLQTLLATASVKFLASIGGLLGSIIQSMTQNRQVLGSMASLNRIHDLLEKHMSYASAERIAADQYGHAQRQTARLEAMGTEITMALSDKIGGALANLPVAIGQEFASALKPMETQLETVTNDLAKGNNDALEQMVKQFTEEVSGASQQSMDGVVSQLSALSNTLQTTASTLGSGNEGLSESLEAAVTALHSASKSMEASLSGASETASAQLTESSDKAHEMMSTLIERFETQQEKSAASIERLVERFNESSQAMQNEMQQKGAAATSEIAQTMQDNITKILNQSASQTSSMGQALAGQVDELGNTMTGAIDKLMTDLDQRLRASIGGLEQSIKEWAQSTETVSGSLNKINSELDRNAAGLERSGQTINNASSAFESASSTLRTTVQPLNTAAQSASSAIAQLAEASKSLSENVQGSLQSIETSVAANKAAIEELKHTWEAQSTHLKGADQQLEQAFRSISENLGKSLDTLHRYTDGMSENVGRALSELGGMVSELSEAIEELNTQGIKRG